MAGYDSIFAKVERLFTANIQDLLTRALNSNKLAVFDEEVNRLNGALEQITVAHGESLGREKTLTRELDELEDEVAALSQRLNLALDKEEQATSSSQPTQASQYTALAKATLSQRNTKSEILTSKQHQLEEAKEQIARLYEARVKLGARIDVLRAQRSKLAALIEERKAAAAQGRALGAIDVRSAFSPDALIRSEQEALERQQGIAAARSLTLGQNLDDVLGNEALDEQLDALRVERKQLK
ncbi:MAG: PspA/IM30 family protein [Chloroflexi bacterium]|nr:PspA/IM30 family protein [Chloroflexota bacterium]